MGDAQGDRGVPLAAGATAAGFAAAHRTFHEAPPQDIIERWELRQQPAAPFEKAIHLLRLYSRKISALQLSTGFPRSALVRLLPQGIAGPGGNALSDRHCGYVWILALEPGQWNGLARVMGSPEWMQMEMFQEMLVRAQNADAMYPLIEQWTMEHSKWEIMEQCQAAGCPITAVFTVAEAAEHPHLKEREYFVDLEHPVLGKVRDLGAPFKLPESPGGPRQPAPLLGQHNAEVYGSRSPLPEGALHKKSGNWAGEERREGTPARAPASAHGQRGASPLQACALRPVTKRRASPGGGVRSTGGEILVRRMTNAIRLHGLASLRASDEAQNRQQRRRECLPLRGSVRKRASEAMGWLATERNQAAVCVKQGDLRSGIRTVFMRAAPKSRERSAGVRAAIVARKRL